MTLTRITQHFISGLRVGLSLILTVSTAQAAGLQGAGSTAAAPLYTKWGELYLASHGTALQYQAIGSSAGLEKFRTGQVDFGASDVALSPHKSQEIQAISIPTVISGVVPVVHVAGVRAGRLVLSGEVLAAIYARTITSWNDPKIAALNPDIRLPAHTIKPVARADGSGTTYILTDYLSKVSPTWKPQFGQGFTAKWPDGVRAEKGSQGMANAVKELSGAIGYVEYAYALQNNLAFVRMKNREGVVVMPESRSFLAAIQRSEWMKDAHYEAMLTDLPGRDTWPITGGTFVIFPKVTATPEKTIAAVRFFTWSFMHGDKAAESLDYVRLPDRVQARVFRELSQIKNSKGEPINWGGALKQ